jgi:2-polyprenyl-3-methyl-5-hydroxy-6-metoxy-1,4-benzoquinol methylase
MTDIKQQVREVYNHIGWQEVAEGDDGECRYQNAHYEDLRPVSREYIHRCHLRVCRHLAPTGKYLLDAGSGPIQYPEYLEYSKGYQYRVCADISAEGLKEARKRIGLHGLFVVCDIASLPFQSNSFDGVVSLHTIHHLPQDEHARAYDELYRVLSHTNTAAIVNGWGSASLANLANWLVRIVRWVRTAFSRRHPAGSQQLPASNQFSTGTFVKKHDAGWFRRAVADHLPTEIWVWRSVNVHFLRTFIHERLGGRFLLRVLYGLEERIPHFLGKNGQYPLIVIRKA